MRWTPEYKSWLHMRDRCLNIRNKKFQIYGGRGITICDRWDSFLAFFEDMGKKPGPGYSIDRKNNDGNYEPSNCHWGTPKQQARNQSRTIMVMFNGRRMALAEAAEQTGVSLKLLHKRIAKGWPLQKALTQKSQMQDSLMQKAKAAGIGYSSVHQRIHRGWTEAEALSVPVKTGPTLKELAAKAGVNYSTARGRVQRGIPVDLALSTPDRLKALQKTRRSGLG